jgi:von Willebrand factor type A domain
VFFQRIYFKPRGSIHLEFAQSQPIPSLIRNHGTGGDDDNVHPSIFHSSDSSTNESYEFRVDNSESSRNGDYLYASFPPSSHPSYTSLLTRLPTLYSPSRFGAQSEAVSMIFNAKTGANPESSVGLMSMGGKGPEVLVTFTTDIGKVLDGLHRMRIWGEGHLSTAISVAGVRNPLTPPPGFTPVPTQAQQTRRKNKLTR